MNVCLIFNERPVLNRLRLVRTSNQSRLALISFLQSLIGPVQFFEVLGLWWTGLGLGLSPWRSKTETGLDFPSLPPSPVSFQTSTLPTNELSMSPTSRSLLIKAQLIDLRRRKHKDMHAKAKNAPKWKNLTLVHMNQGLWSKQNISTMPLQFELPHLWNRCRLQVLHMLLWMFAFIHGRAIDWMRLQALHQNLASLYRNGTACWVQPYSLFYFISYNIFRTPMPILDCEGHLVAILAGCPNDDSCQPNLSRQAT